MPPLRDLDFWPFDREVGVGVACDLGYPCAKFRLPRPFGFRVRADVRDIRWSDGQKDDGCRSPLNAPPLRGGGIIILLAAWVVNDVSYKTELSSKAKVQKVNVWTLVTAPLLHESDLRPAALYNLGTGSWLAWANGTAQRTIIRGAASRHTIYCPNHPAGTTWCTGSIELVYN